jgi:methionyl aminopeptidase
MFFRPMVHLKSAREIAKLRASADLVGRTLAEVGRHIAPGVTTMELDALAETFIRDHGAEPAFKGHRAGNNVFPGSLCVSADDKVVHGIPGDEVLQEGQLLSVDCGVLLDGFIGDSAYTFPVGEISEEAQELCRVTYESLRDGIAQARAGNRVGDIGHAVSQRCEGYGVVRELCGHGVGRELWEEPQVPNYGRPGRGRKLKRGLTICIEPMVNIGTADVVTDADGWTVRTADRSLSAHYEHMVAVTPDGPDVLSTFDHIEAFIDAPYHKAPLPNG